MKYDMFKIQKSLADKGFYPASMIDGIAGSKTNQAIVDFKKSVGLKARSYIGPLTYAALVGGRNVNMGDLLQNKEVPFWLRVAYSYLGLREYKGIRHNPVILRWWTAIRKAFTDDETPWCAAFVGGVLEECNIKSTRSAMARSYSKSEKFVKLNNPCLGSVVVFWRKNPKSPSGHVGFLVGKDEMGRYLVLGGNQGNTVSIKPFSSNRVVGFYWPYNLQYNRKTSYFDLPVLDIKENLSTNEA